ncbi:hypothetical protein KIPB_006666, partial [Kipferlia bialata]
KVFRLYQQDYLEPLTAVLKAAIVEKMQDFTQQQLFEERSVVVEGLEDALESAGKLSIGEPTPYVNIPYIQLRNIEFPDPVEEAIINLQCAVVDTDIAAQTRELEEVLHTTDLYAAYKTGNITMIDGEAVGQGYTQSAEFASQIIDVAAEADAYTIAAYRKTTVEYDSDVPAAIEACTMHDYSDIGADNILTCEDALRYTTYAAIAETSNRANRVINVIDIATSD